jgi:hypothetical protein
MSLFWKSDKILGFISLQFRSIFHILHFENPYVRPQTLVTPYLDQPMTKMVRGTSKYHANGKWTLRGDGREQVFQLGAKWMNPLYSWCGYYKNDQKVSSPVFRPRLITSLSPKFVSGCIVVIGLIGENDKLIAMRAKSRCPKIITWAVSV